MLPRRLPKPAKRASRWRSTAHCNFIRSFACSIPNCTSGDPTEVAHVRNRSGAGMSQKPDDFRTVSLCRSCHSAQHREGEFTFWKTRQVAVEDLIAEFIKASPKSREIADIMRERGQ